MIIACAASGIATFYWGRNYLYAAKRLKELSYRPYWQINKYIMTGKREPEEEQYINTGKLLTTAMRGTIKLSIETFKLIFRMI